MISFIIFRAKILRPSVAYALVFCEFRYTYLVYDLNYIYIIKTFKFYSYSFILPLSHSSLSFSTNLEEKKNFSSKNSENNATELDPLFITGFVDGEGCFGFLILKNKYSNSGWKVKLTFEIHLHKKDEPLLDNIGKFFAVGKVYLGKKNERSIKFLVQSQKDIAKIIEHFDKYPLITKKNSDFLIWKEVFNYIKDNSNITTEGLKRIVAMKAHHNLGLSEKLKYAFPDVIAVARPIVKQQTLKDLNWLAGFTTAEGSFIVSIFITKRTKLGKAVKLIFQITQHSRDEKLMRSLIELFKCGNIYKNRDTFDFRVTKFDDIVNKIIPFFKKYPILGVKALDFADFCKAAELMKNKAHLTKDGLEQIRKIKAGMNRGRSHV